MQQIKIYGTGGQGVVTAANILVRAVTVHEGKYARSVPAYGYERRGAPVFAGVMIDSQPIVLASFVYEPNYVLVFDPTVLDKGIDPANGVQPGSVLVANTDQERVLQRLRSMPFEVIYHVNARRIALGVLGRDIPNSAMLGALAVTGLVGLESVCAALGGTFSGKAGESNADAAREAYRCVRQV